jgi:hypothetical protein
MTTLGVFRDDFINAANCLTVANYTTTTQNAGVLAASLIANATENYCALSGQAGAQAITTDTAANIIARLQVATQVLLAASGAVAAGVQGGFPAGVPNLINLTFEVILINNNTASGAITLTGGAGVTIGGTNTIAITTSRTYLATVTGPNSLTLQNIGSGTV